MDIKTGIRGGRYYINKTGKKIYLPSESSGVKKATSPKRKAASPPKVKKAALPKKKVTSPPKVKKAALPSKNVSSPREKVAPLKKEKLPKKSKLAVEEDSLSKIFVREGTINGADVKLHVNIVSKPINNGIQYHISIPLPKNYTGQLAKEKKVKEKGLFYSNFDITTKESQNNINEEEIIEKLGHDFQYVLFLHGFYLTSRFNKLQESEEERQLLAGLGKQTLCKVFNKIFEILGVDIDKVIVSLNASGQREMTKAEEERYEELSSKYSINTIINMIKKSSPSVYQEILENGMLKEIKTAKYAAQILTSQEIALKLAEYYHSAFGMEIVKEELENIIMTGDLSLFLKKCKL